MRILIAKAVASAADHAGAQMRIVGPRRDRYAEQYTYCKHAFDNNSRR